MNHPFPATEGLKIETKKIPEEILLKVALTGIPASLSTKLALTGVPHSIPLYFELPLTTVSRLMALIVTSGGIYTLTHGICNAPRASFFTSFLTLFCGCVMSYIGVETLFHEELRTWYNSLQSLE